MSSFSDKNKKNISTENNVLTIRTVQISPFRTLMTALKDILLETNITFEPDGMRIINMDKSHTILAHLYLAAQNFEFYECKKEKIIIGVNMFHLFKLINSIDNDDTLTIYIENSDYFDGIVSHLALKFENGKYNRRHIALRIGSRHQLCLRQGPQPRCADRYCARPGARRSCDLRRSGIHVPCKT